MADIFDEIENFAELGSFGQSENEYAPMVVGANTNNGVITEMQAINNKAAPNRKRLYQFYF